MPTAHIGTERLYYELSGEGPALVLIRGLTRSMRYWGPLLEHLQGDFRILMYDHRGIGRSPIAHRGFLMADLARDLAGLMAHVGMERANIFGLSLGGMVAQHLALDHPERVEKLILGSTYAGGKGSVFPSVRVLAALAVAARLPPRLGVKLMGPRLMSPAFSRAHPGVIQSWAEVMEGEPTDPQVAFRQALSGALHDVSARLGDITAPTLVLTGDADRLIDARNSEAIARAIPGAKLQVLPGAGHEITAECAPQVAAAIKGFLLADPGADAQASAATG